MSSSETQIIKSQIRKGSIEEKTLVVSFYKLLVDYLRINKEQSRKLFKIAREIRRGLRDDYDFVCAITGKEGSGKTTLEIILAILVDPKFNLEKQLSLLPSTNEIKSMFRRIRHYGALGIDEAIKILHKQEWYNVLQRIIIQMYATERFHNKCTFLCIPRFTDLNEHFRNHRINCWIDILDRGVAFMKVPVPVPYFSDPWLMDKMAKKYEWLLKIKRGSQITIEDMQRIEKKNPCYVDTIYFPDLPTQIKELFINLRNASRKYEERMHIEDVPKDKVRKALALTILKERESGKKNVDLSKVHDMSESLIKILLREARVHVKNKLLQEKQELKDKW
ncbi:MAG TPA: hypothetical protein ENI22_00630 [Candidatus Pacearchaeota archaeon]|nr:hypothetical protein [Candidatus Pacearchaeota archaeon]